MSSRAGVPGSGSRVPCAMFGTGGPRAGVPAVYTTVPAGAALADKTGACC